jgi:superfamily II DNA/RNA helicase
MFCRDRKVSKSPSILILEPTRELSVQVANELQMVADCHHMRTTAIYGGVSFSPQVHALRDGVDIVVATPGRALDHISRGTLDLSKIDHVVLDEGDTMLEMGFQDSVETIIANVRRPGQASQSLAGNYLNQMADSVSKFDRNSNSKPRRSSRHAPFEDESEGNALAEFDSFHEKQKEQQQRKELVEPNSREDRACQFLLFSATMPAWIAGLTSKHMTKPVFMNAVAEGETRLAETISHYATLLPPVKDNRDNDERMHVVSQILEDVIVAHCDGGQSIIFANTKDEVDKLSTLLANGSRRLRTLPLHGDVSQSSRQSALDALKTKAIDAIVATDVAARGLDVAGVDLVVHTKAPIDVDTFVHRSGRTGRAGRSGKNILLFASNEHSQLKVLERDLHIQFAPLAVPSNMNNRMEHVREKLSAIDDSLAGQYVGLAREIIEGSLEKIGEQTKAESVASDVASDGDEVASKVTTAERTQFEKILCRALAATAGNANEGSW